LWSAWQQLATSFQPARDDEFDPPNVVCNFGVLETHGAALSATFDARLLPVHDPMALHQAFAEKVLTHGVRGVRAEAVIERAAPGMKSEPTSPLLAELSAAVAARGLPQEPKAKATSTEAGVFFRSGANAAVFGPGVSVQNAHTPNEHNRVRDLELAIDIYEDLIQRLCMTDCATESR
jgi:acetylornithine deacetylase/succinyl-diaminopimelate desuccinylase-like protein